MVSLYIGPLVIQSHTRPSTVLLHLCGSLFGTFQHTEHVLSRQTGEIALGPASTSDELRELLARVSAVKQIQI